MPLGAGGGYDKLVDTLRSKKVVINVQSDQTTNWANVLISSAPFILLIGFWICAKCQARRMTTSSDNHSMTVLNVAFT